MRVRASLKPRIQLLPADWADAYFKIPPRSAKSGNWRTVEAEYTRKILNAIVDPNISNIYVMTSAQVFKTTMAMIIQAYFIDYDPSPMMVLLPTIDFAEKYAKLKWEPTFSQIDILKDKVADRKSRDGSNTMRLKSGPGWSLIIAGGNSPVDLAGHSVKILIVDESDRIPGSVGDEGDPCFLAEQRIESFKKYGYKIIYFSTPTVADRSRIEKKVLLGDQQKPFIKCPHCNYQQPLEFFPKKDKDTDQFYGGLIWDKDVDLMGKTLRHHPETARYVCANIECKKEIFESDRLKIMADIEWIPTAEPINKQTVSFIGLNRMYSSLSTWAQLAKEWVEIKDDPESLPGFYNTSLDLVYRTQETPEVNESIIMSWSEDYLTEANPNLPDDILFITAFVDTHPDRLELFFNGWGIGEENWLIHYEQIWGDPDHPDVWQTLDERLEKKWLRNDGVELSVGGIGKNGYRNYCTVVDSGGYLKNTQSVYEYTRARFHLGIMATKGRAGNGLPILLSQSLVGKLKNTPLQNVGSDTVKEIMWNRLKHKPGGPKTIHHTKAFCDYKFYEGLLCEPPFAIVNKRTNTKTIIWKKKNPRMRNEPWDGLIGNYVALKIADPEFEKIKESLIKQKNEVRNKQQAIPQNKVTDRMRPINSSINDFINGWKK